MSFSSKFLRALRRNWVWLVAPMTIYLGVVAYSTTSHTVNLLPPEIWLHDRLTSVVLDRTSIEDDRVLVVDIDEPSMSKFGRWPWPRAEVARLFRTLLDEYQVSLIGSDILFIDPEGAQSQGEVLLQGVLSDPRVLNALVWSSDGTERKGDFATSPNRLQVQTDSSVSIPVASAWLSPLLVAGNGAVAHISPQVSPDGLVRKIAPIVCDPTGACIESLALGLYRMLLGIEPAYRLSQGEWFLGKENPLPVGQVDRDGYSWISWTGYATADMYVSAADVLLGKLPKEKLKGRIVIVGSTSTGLYDQIASPFSPTYPAVEVHRNQLSALLEGRLDKTVPQGRGYDLLLGFVVMLLIWLGFCADRLSVGVASAFVVLVAWIFFVSQARLDREYWPFAATLGMWVVYSVFMLSMRPLVEKRKRIALIQRFGSYVAPQVLLRLQSELDGTVVNEHQRCEMSVLFADVRGYTRFSETVSAQELARVTRLLMNELTRIVLENEGTVDKYMGDSIMAFWGAPLNQEEHAERAFCAAVSMYKAIERLSAEGVLPGFKIGVGVNTGEAVVGDMGSDFRYDYSVIGAAVNLASYFEEGTRTGPYNIIIGEETFRRSVSAQKLDCAQFNVLTKGSRHPAFGYELK